MIFMENYDIIIVGAGPAGLTAGMYAGRQNSKTLIIDRGFAGGLGLEVPLMQNYPGFDLISGMELIQKMKAQTENYCEIKENETIQSIEKTEDGFLLKTRTSPLLMSEESDEIREFKAKAIILATGASHRHLNVPGEAEFLGRGVAYCATCDGMFFIDRTVLMVGGGNSAAQEALYLKNLGCNVKLVHRRDQLRCEHHLQKALEEKEIEVIWNATVEEIKGDMVVESVRLNRNGQEEDYKTDGVFIAIGDDPSNEIAKELGIDLDEDGYIITDKRQATSVEHVYSAGDITGGVKQWVVACGEGAVAAISAYNDLNL
ncbi:thioredoxin-disulfide reductase TrxB [Methanobrevibacter ruminantium M1]|uniref:Thioredoxin-disulfide reductase TrxB n=2 Tax=Methanobrevibacter ruminantium TaxID=83816 RepID=D3E414_METRM|nr:thioredoxin-disulfide reductase TrxB [Methanobrevibacter ruminantium M1]